MFTQKVTNLTYLNEISKGDKNFINEMIDIFLLETPDEINQLEKAITHTDFDKIRSISHHMKSTIPFVGLDIIIGAELAQIENLAIDRKEIAIIADNFKKIEAAFNKAHQELSI